MTGFKYKSRETAVTCCFEAEIKNVWRNNPPANLEWEVTMDKNILVNLGSLILKIKVQTLSHGYLGRKHAFATPGLGLSGLL